MTKELNSMNLPKNWVEDKSQVLNDFDEESFDIKRAWINKKSGHTVIYYTIHSNNNLSERVRYYINPKTKLSIKRILRSMILRKDCDNHVKLVDLGSGINVEMCHKEDRAIKSALISMKN